MKEMVVIGGILHGNLHGKDANFINEIVNDGLFFH